MGAFAIPAALIGVGVVGLWLLGPKKSSTSKPDSMPKLNSGLRGETMPITFGTNKVSAHMVWSKNYTPVRQRSSGKGKGGGSGGFGSAKGGGSAGTQYLYYWDLMFHYGMFDVPSGLSRGWVGTDTISPVVMEALSLGFSTTLATYILSRVGDNNAATISYTDAFVGNGYPTGDPSLSSWSYFQSQEGLNCAFPYTGYVGFNQLELGQTPAVPQLFFEWAPLASFGFGTGTGFLSKTTTITEPVISNPAFVTDDNGKYYAVGNANSGYQISVHAVDGSVTTLVSDAQWLTDVTTLFPQNYNAGVSGVFPAGGKYFYVTYGVVSGSGVGTGVLGCIMYQVNTDGSVTRRGGKVFSKASANVGEIFRSPVATGVLGSGNVLMVNTDQYDQAPHLFMLPSYTNFLGDDAVILAEWSQRNEDIAEVSGLYFMAPGSYRGGSRNRVASVINEEVYFYFGKAEMQWQNDNVSGAGWNSFLAGLAPAHLNGLLIKIDTFDFVNQLDYLYQGPTTEFGVPYADVQLKSDGAAGTAYDDYGPLLASGSGINTLVFATRRYSNDNYLARTTAYLNFDKSLLGSFQSEFATVSDFSHDTNNIVAAYPGDGQLYIQAAIGAEGSMWANFGSLNPSALDVTPAYIIYRILTHPAFGMATSAIFGFTVTEERVEQVSYLRAVQECRDQGCYISVTYDQTGNVLDIINDLLSLYSGYLTENDGVISFGVVRPDETVVRTLDNSHFVVDAGKPPVKISKAALEDGYNKISFSYLDRGLDYGQNQVIQADEVDMDLNGPRPKDWNTRYVMAGSLATQIAVRALWSNLYGHDTYDFATGWKDWDLRPGDLVTLVDSFDPTLSAGVRARLLKRRIADVPGSYKWEAVRDYLHINNASASYTNIASISPGAGSILEAPEAPLWQTAYELSREFQGSHPEIYFGYGQRSMVMGAQLHMSVDGATYLLTQDTQPYILSGIIASSLQDRPKGYVETGVEFYLFPTSGFRASTPTYVQTYMLDDITASVRAQGASVLIVGSEGIAVENLTLLGQNHYRAKSVFRGWGGTPVSGHSSGAHFHAHGAGIFNHEITQDDIGVTISYKIVPYNFAGKTFDISSVNASTYTIRGNFWLAREQPITRLWVNSGVTQPRSTSLKGPYVGVTSGGCDLIATWPRADNSEGFGAGGFGAGSFGHFIMADSVAWRVDVYSSNGAAVSSFVVNTGYFDYTVAQNSTDFNGFGRNLVLRTTPYTVKGDGPVTDVRSVSMNW